MARRTTRSNLGITSGVGSVSYTDKEIEDIVRGEAPVDLITRMQRSPKDSDRFDKYLRVLQNRAKWKDKILLPIGEHLYIVERENDKSRVVKCDCGQEFGDYRENWKLEALIYIRDTDAKLEEIYPGVRKPNKELCEVREYICPGCGTLLEVEASAPGCPPVFSFLPDIDGFYEEWLGRPLENSSAEWYKDKSLEKIRMWSLSQEK